MVEEAGRIDGLELRKIRHCRSSSQSGADYPKAGLGWHETRAQVHCIEWVGSHLSMALHIQKILVGLVVIGLALIGSGCAVLPTPLTQVEIQQRVQENLAQLTQFQEPVARPITLFEAMARALKYNLETRVQGLKEMVAHRQLDLAHYDMLPKVVADAAYNGRSNFAGASSQSLETGQQSLVSSTSSDKNIYTSNLALSWDVLDFGLSYVRAEQAADDVLIAEEDKRRIANRVIQDVRSAFWKAVGAERALGRLAFLQDWVTQALGEVHVIRERALADPLTSLQYERELLSAQREIQQLYQDLSLSRIHLAELMNLDPGEPYELAVPEHPPLVSKVEEKLEDLEYRALMNRPELRKVDYQKRINAKETKAAILELLPNLHVYMGGNYDSNNFLFHNNWLNYGAKVSWNLLNVFRHPVRLQVIDAQEKVLDMQSLALTMALMSQVHVSVAQYHAAMKDVATGKRYLDTQMAIADQVQRAWSLNRLSEHLVIREKMQGLVAELRYESALAKLEMAYANVLAAIGEDPFPTDITGDGVEELAVALQERWEWLDRPEVFARVDQSETQPEKTNTQPQRTNIQLQETVAQSQETDMPSQETTTQPQERDNP
ncbi:TolC family protein [Nitrospira sp.]|uniref:TolC family protein n=1 Tax=Nitrospira sp. TaxID=70125 RepID=UPI003FCCEFAA